MAAAKSFGNTSPDKPQRRPPREVSSSGGYPADPVSEYCYDSKTPSTDMSSLSTSSTFSYVVVGSLKGITETQRIDGKTAEMVSNSLDNMRPVNNGSSSVQEESQSHQNSITLAGTRSFHTTTSSMSANNRRSSNMTTDPTFSAPPATHLFSDIEETEVVLGSLKPFNNKKPQLHRNESIDSHGNDDPPEQPINEANREADSTEDGTNEESSERAESIDSVALDQVYYDQELDMQLSIASESSDPTENPELHITDPLENPEVHVKTDQSTNNTPTMDEIIPKPPKENSPSKEQSKSVTGVMSSIENTNGESTSLAAVISNGCGSYEEITSDGCKEIASDNHKEIASSVDHIEYAKPEYDGTKPHSNQMQDGFVMLQPEECITDETTELLPQRSSGRRRAKRRKLRRRVTSICCVSGYLFTMLLAGLVVVPYETGLLVNAIMNSTSNGTSESFQNDTVLVSYSIPRTYVYSRSAMVTSTSTNKTELRPYMIDLFLVDKEKLAEITETSELSQQKPRTSFDNCPNYICAFPPLYLVAASDSELTLNISINNFTLGLTDVRVVVFANNFNQFNEFMTTGDAMNAVKNESLSSNNYILNLTGNEVKSSGYYYIAIQKLEGSATKWFSAQLFGIRTIYNTSSLTPYCTMDKGNGHSCVISGLDGDTHEILARVQVDGNGTTGYTDWPSFPPYYIRYSIGSPKPSTFGRLVVEGSICIVMMVVTILMTTISCYLCGCRWQRRSNAYP